MKKTTKAKNQRKKVQKPQKRPVFYEDLGFFKRKWDRKRQKVNK